MAITIRDKEIFVEQLAKEFIAKITGENEERVIGKNPEEKFFVGKLSTIETKKNMNSSRSFINQIGVDFIIKECEIKNAILDINPKGEFYFRVNPTLDEQRNEILNEYRLLNEEDKDITFDEIYNKLTENKVGNEKYEVNLIPVYEKIKLDNSFNVKLKLKDIYDVDKGFGFKEYRKEFTKILDEKIEELLEKKSVYKVNKSKIKLWDLKDEITWEEYINNSSEDKVRPLWDFSIEVQIKRYIDDLCKVSIYLINQTRGTDDEGSEKKKNNSKQVNTLFNASLDIMLNGGEYQPIHLDYFKDDYKYDSNEFAIGNNCSVIRDKNNKGLIKTTNIPIFIQKRLKTRSDLVVEFKDLIEEPVHTLMRIYQCMNEELNIINYDLESREKVLTKDAKKKFKEEIKLFTFEIQRFKNGIEKIENYDFIKRAFIYMNKAFSMTSKGYSSWRLFQIVFIVSLIPDICVSEYGEESMGNFCKIDEVDLLYFPTGGGKTEAFLGAVIFTLFFDRIRGKLAGISSIIKYPLRLLSVQQVQRVADILAVSEIIRRESPLLNEGEEFSLGYYVGDTNTPNSLDDKIAVIKKESQEELNDKYKILDKCPFCKGHNVNVILDEEFYRLKHICLNPNCSSGGDLPLYIVDREIYRYLPTVLITTIDKIAAIGYQRDFRNILGEVSHKCKRHGYTSKSECSEKKICKEDVRRFDIVSIKDPAPTIIIQDELHLVRESLGAFDGHYETLFQYMIGFLGSSKKKVKIVGATATISDYQLQLQHLYGKTGIRFPCESPYNNKNFYSKVDEDEVHRYILGYAPYSKAVINSVVYSMKYLKEIIWSYYINPNKLLNIKGITISSKEEALELLEDYWFLLEYNNVKQDGNKIIGAIESPINIELSNEGIQKFEFRKMTGDDSFQDVRKVLAEVENKENIFEGFNLITATSMISHGVDADRFNNMIFFGMPGNTAEYIQAYSRVGRKYPGLVIVLLRPGRDKDLSYLKHFIKFHEYKDILVDPVPINRWATRAIDKTFPGVFQAIIINYYDINLQFDVGTLYSAKNFKRAITQGKIKRDELINHILNAYKCIEEDGSNIDLGKQYKEKIEEKVNEIFNEISNSDFTKTDSLQDILCNILGERVMTSLRDSEQQVKISLESVKLI